MRSRWFVLYTLAFAVLGLGISYVAAVGAGGAGLSGFGRTTAGLINLVLLVVPLMALTAGAGSITNYAGLTPARQAWLEARRAKARQPADGTEP